MKNERGVFEILADLKQALKEGQDLINCNLETILIHKGNSDPKTSGCVHFKNRNKKG